MVKITWVRLLNTCPYIPSKTHNHSKNFGSYFSAFTAAIYLKSRQSIFQMARRGRRSLFDSGTSTNSATFDIRNRSTNPGPRDCDRTGSDANLWLRNFYKSVMYFNLNHILVKLVLGLFTNVSVFRSDPNYVITVFNKSY